jgi:hypothetical protein
MDKVNLKFKELDLRLLQEKKNFIIEELKKEGEYVSKLNDILDRINNRVLELTNANYDSD